MDLLEAVRRVNACINEAAEFGKVDIARQALVSELMMAYERGYQDAQRDIEKHEQEEV